jgi:hypothetical protein
MMEEGKPTGITREDVNKLGEVRFEGRQAQLTDARTNVSGGVEHDVTLWLDAGTTRFALYGYFSGGEFMEVERARLD